MSFYLLRKLIRKLPGVIIKLVPKPEHVLREGFGAREVIGEICAFAGYKSVLIVTDKTLYSLGYHEKILDSLEANKIKYNVLSNTVSEPTIDIISEGRNVAVNYGADCIIALGGGSVLDSCKIIAAGAKMPKRNIENLLHKFIYVNGKTLPIIAVPSTAGTGAEITVAAVVKNKRGIKCSTIVIGLNVTHVVLDSELTTGAPESVTVCCGIDALSHGIEGCLADIKTSKEDMNKSLECVRIVLENLPILISSPDDKEARQKMCLAAYYGGNAINKQLAGYVHAFAHSIGALYHIPHGKAIALCLIPIVSYHKNICRDKLAQLSVYCGFSKETDDQEAAADSFVAALEELLETCGFERGCDLIDEKDYKKLIRMINADSINYSPPKTLNNKEIARLLDEIKKGGNVCGLYTGTNTGNSCKAEKIF
ncbi:iron-containing alcohol dehydrogenase [Acetivibrio clariflavus]|uniref:Alcohol dehydrogenase, class IV n=1 Tax=Acetivibrio clariflavus (strain DSM 19732 / NBRC 101661 / EBR45) TaxID=720554 RepID=G8M0W9_ACECE|nr:iron-containing alcohol dehydrogenase [Acetivibrio clariflavus]AEV70212.1 alcohol dehydrogenase, class IV [Acetivibrio clariflavus DSM 19732]HOQ01724.1 iron-containing alcohol dehydrogenase [Acetivibrio clariflavus]